MESFLKQIYTRAWDRLWRSAANVYQYGTSIYDSEWDVLIILDGCRFDTFEHIQGEHSFLGKNEPVYSIGSSSATWMKRTFTEQYREEQSKTAYVTGNPYSRRLLKDEWFAFVDHVWEYAWDDEIGTIPPRPITDRAIDIWRAENPERMIIHYMQPHYPFLRDQDLHRGINLDYFGSQPWDSIWERLRANKVSRERVQDAYRKNLEIVLKDVELLAQNVSADTSVITADHGNAFGEYGQYGHPNQTLNPYVRKVPWCYINTVDNKIYEPTLSPESMDKNVEEKLKDLGYL